MTDTTDRTALAGKNFIVESRWPVVVVGAGPSGIAAALAAAKGGGKVLLVDEHPAPPGLLGMDVPYLFGGRLDASVQNSARMLETLVEARPGLAEAMDAGVEVLPGVSVWGAFARGPASRTLATPLLGLSDDTRAWLVAADSIVVAAGTRDLALPFRGWELPGVIGAKGFLAAVTLYRAFSGRRIVVLGSGAAADAVLKAAALHGITLAAHVAEPTSVVAYGKLEVEAVEANGAAIDADTVVLAIDWVPNVELFDLLGAPVSYDAYRGGFIPSALPPYLSAVGGCTGRMEQDDRAARRQAWLSAMETEHAELCRCEGVTILDLLGLSPPRYLNDQRAHPLVDLGPLNQDQVKRLTRAGMGACQGRRCRDSVHALLTRAGQRPPMASYRPPLRPLPLAALAALPEPDAMRANWTGWFGIATQWLPHWEPAPDDAEFIGMKIGDGSPWDLAAK